SPLPALPGIERLQIRQDRLDAIADLVALLAQARAFLFEVTAAAFELRLERVAFAAELLNRGDRLLHALLQPREDLVFTSRENHLLQRFLFHHDTSFTGRVDVSRCASCCCSTATSSCVSDRSNA